MKMIPMSLVPNDPQLASFLELAELQQIPHSTLIGLLTSQGWTEKEAYAALAGHYRARGLEVPTRIAPTASAKEAFFYLLLFATLATWTIAFYLLAATLIERWLPDPLFHGYRQAYDTETIASSLASLIVAFPLYLLISRALARESAAHPEKLDSSVRKWLTYLALVVAACIFMGDLITALAYLLRGEITTRFLTKSLVILTLSGGVVSFYFGGLRKTEPQPAARNKGFAVAASTLVTALILLGFLNLGSPHIQRDLRADTQRTRALFDLSQQIHLFYLANASQLPPTLSVLPTPSQNDPITQAPYVYHPQQSGQYEVCATFTSASTMTPAPNPWAHPPGPHCFPLNAVTQPGFPIPYPTE